MKKLALLLVGILIGAILGYGMSEGMRQQPAPAAAVIDSLPLAQSKWY